MVQQSLFSARGQEYENGTPMIPPIAARSHRMCLYVQDAQGFRVATPQEVLDAGRDCIDVALPAGEKFDHPDVVRQFFRAKMAGLKREVLGVLFLDNQLRRITYSEPFGGTLNACPVYPREIISMALAHHAAAIIIGHPHPSGDARASAADIQLVRRLKQACDTMDLRLLDSVIVAGNSVVSMAEQGQV